MEMRYMPLLDRILWKLGLLRKKHYYDMCGKYERLYTRFVAKRMENDRLLKRVQEESPQPPDYWKIGGSI